jgi:putative membrane protein
MAAANVSLMHAGVIMSRILKFVFVLLVMIIGLAFHLRNDQPVDLDFYLGSISLPFSLYIIVALCVGALLGGLAVLPRLLRLKTENARLRKHLQVNEKELNNLRVIPVKDTH